MFEVFRPAYCECGPSADWFVQEWFSECIYTTWELVAFWIGMSSVMFWIVAQLPQFIANLRNQTAESLSPWFLFQWLSGDSFNLLGCILTGDQLATQTFTATYFIFADCIIISQYIYYSIQENEKVAFEEKNQGPTPLERDRIADFKESLKETSLDFRKIQPKISIVATNLSEGLLENHDVQHEYRQYHPVACPTGRSGAAMISHVMDSHKALYSPDVDRCNRASQTSTMTSGALSPERDSSTGICLQGNRDGQVETSVISKVCVGVLRLEESERRACVSRSINDRNQSLAQDAMSVARLGRVPEIAVEQLFPTANAMKRHLRRLVNQYGLECGPHSLARLTIYPAKSLEKHLVDKRMGGPLTSKLGSGLKKRPVKAAACLASLLAVKTSTNFFQRSGSSEPSDSLAFVSRRRLMGVRYPGSGTSITSVSSTAKMGTQLLLTCGDGPRPLWLKSFGKCLGWGSSVLYFGSRFSQIALNYQRRSAEGLSLAMLTCAILANACMGVSILMRAKSLEDLANKAPWILGSVGTISLDLFILLQAKYLEVKCTKLKSAQTLPDERTYLLA